MWTFLSRRREMRIFKWRIIMRSEGKNTLVLKIIRPC